jgi:hypothetical protein
MAQIESIIERLAFKKHLKHVLNAMLGGNGSLCMILAENKNQKQNLSSSERICQVVLMILVLVLPELSLTENQPNF